MGHCTPESTKKTALSDMGRKSKDKFLHFGIKIVVVGGYNSSAIP